MFEKGVEEITGGRGRLDICGKNARLSCLGFAACCDVG